VNRGQIARQVEFLLRAAKWQDGTSLVFAAESVGAPGGGSALVSLGMPEASMKEKRLPLVFIRPGAETPDEERPDLLSIEFTVSLIVANLGDMLGRATLVGSNRATAGSQGRGFLEVEERIKTTLLQLGPASGLPIIYRGGGAMQPTMLESLGYVVFGDLKFRAQGTTGLTYQAPSGLARTGSGSSVALSWTASPRFDFYGYILRRASGATPPATIAAGTGVTLSSITATSVTDSPAAGTYSYSLFAQYDDTASGAAVGTSPGQPLASVVVS